jgi:hypothetical protein
MVKSRLAKKLPGERSGDRPLQPQRFAIEAGHRRACRRK